MCSIRLPARPLFETAECHLCHQEGEFDYLACPDCLRALAAAVQPDRLVENAIFVAAGSPDWWRKRGSICCSLIPPIGNYIVAGVMPLLASRRDIRIDNELVRSATTAASGGGARAAPRPKDIFSQLLSVASRGTQTVALDTAASMFSESEIAQLLTLYPVVYVHSSKPSLIILDNEID
jgi:hypothetical protein